MRLPRHFAVFSLGRDRNGVLPPLSWVLPPEVRDSIAAPGFNGFPAAGNAEELAALGEAWRDALPRP
jgi:hypothetical protein